MSRITQMFQNKKPFIAYMTGGDPDLTTTADLIIAMQEAGADMIVVGIPFSDPIAESAVNQAATLRALKENITVDKLFDTIQKIRQAITIPLLFRTYANPVFAYGTERFLQRCQQSNIQGLIIPDVPFEEKDEFAPTCEKYNVDYISFAAPSSEERVVKIAKEAKGFLYCISTPQKESTETIHQIKQTCTIPCVIELGDCNIEQAVINTSLADGFIFVESIVKRVGLYGKQCIPHVKQFIKENKRILKKL